MLLKAVRESAEAVNCDSDHGKKGRFVSDFGVFDSAGIFISGRPETGKDRTGLQFAKPFEAVTVGDRCTFVSSLSLPC